MEDRNSTTFSDSGWETSACCTPCSSKTGLQMEIREVGGTFSFKIVSYEKTVIFIFIPLLDQLFLLFTFLHFFLGGKGQ